MMLPTECIRLMLTFVPARWQLFTLHSLLLVNTNLAYAVLPILYADPFKTLQHHNAATQTRSPWRKERLLRTLVGCIDTSKTLRGLTQAPSSAVITQILTPVLCRALDRLANTPRSSINYLDYMAVHAFLSHAPPGVDSPVVLYPWVGMETLSDLEKQDFRAAQTTISQWVTHSLLSTRHHAVRVIRQQKWYWPPMAFWTEPSSPSSALHQQQQMQQQKQQQQQHHHHHQVMYPHLQTIDIRGIDADSQPHLIQFVQQHQVAYPGVLSQLAMAVRDLDHNFSIALLQSFGSSLRDLELISCPWQIDLFKDDGLIVAPERLERLILPRSMRPLVGFDRYLFRLERLETLGLSVETESVFEDARRRKLAKQEVPLPRLRHLMLQSDTSRTFLLSTLEDAIVAFGQRLESLVVRPSFFFLARDEKLAWAEPESISSASASAMSSIPMPAFAHETIVNGGGGGGGGNGGGGFGFGQDLGIMDNAIPNLLNPRLTHVFVQTYLPALRVLYLADVIALHFSMWSLAACPALESLTLDISGSHRTPQAHALENSLGRTGNWCMCCVPNLRQLHLRGPWRIPYRTLNAMVTQQQVDVVFPEEEGLNSNSNNNSESNSIHDEQSGGHAQIRRLPLRKLEVLDASGAHALTAMEIGRLVGKLPSLKEISVAIQAEERASLKLWTTQHGGCVDVKCTVRSFDSEYEIV